MLDFIKGLSTPQLNEIKRVVTCGVVAKAEVNDTEVKAQLCHKSPPKGYPDDKSQYGDPECYRYPLNTKSRCLASWLYVHQAENKKILGSKASKVISKIKSYAKSSYNLDLEENASEDDLRFNWSEAFVEYYDSETMGERCEQIDLEPEMEVQMEEIKTSENEVIEEKQEVAQKETPQAPKEEDANASQVIALTDELKTLQSKLEELQAYKDLSEYYSSLQATKDSRKKKIEEAQLSIDIESDAQWLKMDDETFDFTLQKLSEQKSVSASAGVKVPADIGSNGDSEDAREVVKQGLAERKQKRNASGNTREV